MAQVDLTMGAANFTPARPSPATFAAPVSTEPSGQKCYYVLDLLLCDCYAPNGSGSTSRTNRARWRG
jgi:hypothetical protein